MNNWFSLQLLIVLYAIFSCWMTRSIGALSKGLWITAGIFDVLIYFVSILLVVCHNNYRYTPEKVLLLSTTESIPLIYALNLLKELDSDFS